MKLHTRVIGIYDQLQNARYDIFLPNKTLNLLKGENHIWEYESCEITERFLCHVFNHTYYLDFTKSYKLFFLVNRCFDILLNEILNALYQSSNLYIFTDRVESQA